jgi:glyoxylase-like metal-dependent hydrolase (beta-lactamase superfamily II)/ferredoxin
LADLGKRLHDNVAGEFFVDSTCIDCDVCRQLAPAIFGDAGGCSFVRLQPRTEDERRQATRALLCCPTGSIGTVGTNLSKAVRKDFPLRIEQEVYFCGFTSPASFGGSSYFVEHPGGNWLIDSPKFLPLLVDAFERMGGIRYIFLTHRDDVAEAHRYARRFRAERIIHRYELSAQPDAEIVIDGNSTVQFSRDFLIVPTFGHTRGHCVLLYRNRFLFTGDHLWWDRVGKALAASEDYCWYSWKLQIESMARLQNVEFEWVLPGHGESVKFPPKEMQEQLQTLLTRIGAGKERAKSNQQNVLHR